jgi:hypothetical protein
MDCKTARLLLHFAGPPAAELDADAARALDAHLGDCADCRDLAESDRAFDAHLGRAVRDVPVPDRLRAALLTRLGAERDAFYRRMLVRAAGAAALVVLAVGLGWYWLNRPPEVTLNDVLATAERKSEKEVTAWLKGIDPRLQAPPRFNYEMLATYGFAEVGGRRVPVLTFAHSFHGVDEKAPAAWARVYVLSDRRLDLDTLRQQVEASGVTGVHAKVLAEDAPPGVVYVVVLSGADLDSFLEQRGRRPGLFGAAGPPDAGEAARL